jgi:hypothetical protein
MPSLTTAITGTKELYSALSHELQNTNLYHLGTDFKCGITELVIRFQQRGKGVSIQKFNEKPGMECCY